MDMLVKKTHVAIYFATFISRFIYVHIFFFEYFKQCTSHTLFGNKNTNTKKYARDVHWQYYFERSRILIIVRICNYHGSRFFWMSIDLITKI